MTTNPPRSALPRRRPPLSNELSWSKTRHDRFAECLRAYYLHYYLSWGGWERNTERWRRQIYVLKKLSNRFTWSGSIVHGAVRDALAAIRAGQPISLEQSVNHSHQLMQHDWAFSSRRRYWHQRIRKEFTGLVEHEYKEPVDKLAWLGIWNRARQAIEGFHRSEWVERAKALQPADWLELDFTDYQTSVFHLEGIKVFAVPDFAFIDRDGSTVIVDWKTGRPKDSYAEQLVGYGLYLHERHHRPLDSMRARLVYLEHGVEQQVTLDAQAFDGFRAQFEKSTRSMKGLLKDVDRNLPLAETAFPKTNNLAICARCPFRRVCNRERTAKPVGLHAMRSLTVLLLAVIAPLVFAGCMHGRCYSNDDCHHGKLCMAVDDEGKPVVRPEKCGKGSVLCGDICTVACSGDSCGAGQKCGTDGCCAAAQACTLNADCPGDEVCREGRCLHAGECHEAEASKHRS